MSIPSWLNNDVSLIPEIVDNTLITTVNVDGVGSYTAMVNVVPQILLSSISTTVLNTANPSEILSFEVATTGWYNTTFGCAASLDSGSNWSSMTQLEWFVKKQNAKQSNTVVLTQPQYISGDSVSGIISLYGGGMLQADAGNTLQWTCDANAVSGSITSGFYGGFNFVTIQQIA